MNYHDHLFAAFVDFLLEAFNPLICCPGLYRVSGENDALLGNYRFFRNGLVAIFASLPLRML